MPDSKPIVCTFESRRSDEMRSLIERFGGTALLAPSMQEVPIDCNSAAIEAVRQIVAGSAAHLILLTGVGTEAMLKIAASNELDSQLIDVMKRIPILVRGPKPAAVLSKLGLKYTVKAPEPNTYKELLEAIDAADIPLSGQTIAVQEYGAPNPELYAGLEERGAHILAVPVYRWALPDDIRPLQYAIGQTIAGTVDVLLFTSAQQVRHILQVAEQTDQRSEWLIAANSTAVASIGPTCSEALQAEGLNVTIEASPPKMGPLVRAAMECSGSGKR